jgi:RNA polymerase sigma-70 factor (ECF subfamily)
MVTPDWDRIVTEHGHVVFGTAWRILGHAADAEDVVQDVFLQAYQVQQAEEVRCWEALLRRLAACRSLDRLRQRRSNLPLDGLALASTAENPEILAEERELASRLRLAIADLPQREAAVFCMRCFEGLSYEQIAEVLRTTVGAVGVALHKARTRLEAALLEGASRW